MSNLVFNIFIAITVIGVLVTAVWQWSKYQVLSTISKRNERAAKKAHQALADSTSLSDDDVADKLRKE